MPPQWATDQILARGKNMQTNAGSGFRASRALMSCLGAIAALIACGQPTVAHAAAIFVTKANGFGGGNPGTIGQYDLTGTAVNASLITGLAAPFGIAASATHLFVGNNNTGNVGQYTLAGATVNAALINAPGVTGVTVSGSDLYLAAQGDGTIKKYLTDGTLVDNTLITGLDGPRQIAVWGSLLFVANSGSGTVGAYTTSGATINASLLSGLGQVTGVAVSEDGTQLFVSSQNTGVTGVYTTAGVPINASLIVAGNPQYLAISGQELYVANFSGTVAQYKTDGTVVNETLISALDGPLAIAVTPEPGSLALIVAGAGLFCTRRSRSRI